MVDDDILRDMTRVVGLSLFLSLAVAPSAQTQAPTRLRGFTAPGSDAERAAEEKFRAVPKPDNAREYMRTITATPHHAGSPASRAVADYILSQFKSWGLDASIESFEALMPYPTERVVEMMAPEHYTLKLDGAGGAAGSGLRRRRPGCRRSTPTRPTATSPASWSTSTTARPTITSSSRSSASTSRARSSSRATAAAGAASSRRSPTSTARSAASSIRIRTTTAISPATCIPTAPYRPELGAQRGSVMDMPIHPGDPLTPGVAAEPGVPRMDRIAVADDSQDPGAADLVRRRAAAAEATSRGRSRRRAWRGVAADHVSRRRRPGDRCT